METQNEARCLIAEREGTEGECPGCRLGLSCEGEDNLRPRSPEEIEARTKELLGPEREDKE